MSGRKRYDWYYKLYSDSLLCEICFSKYSSFSTVFFFPENFCSAFITNMDHEKLIEYVRDYSLIYDQEDKYYMDTEKKEMA